MPTLSKRLLQLAGLLSLLLIAVIVNYFVHRGEDELNPVAEAAQRTAAIPGARLKMEVTYTREGSSKPIVATGTGAFDARGGRSRVVLTVPTPGQAPTIVTSVGDQRTAFIRSPAFAAELPPGKDWLGFEPLLGHNPRNALGSGPGAQGTIEMLRAVGGDVEEVGQENVRGSETTRYKATIDLSQVAKVLGEQGEATLAREYEKFGERAPRPIPVEVWVDDQGLARVVRMVEQLPTAPGVPTLTMNMRMELFDFGARPKIDLPPPGRVLDTTPILRAELGLADGTTLGPLSPPADTPRLPTSDFRQRANAICEKATTAAHRLVPRQQRVVREFGALDQRAVESGAARPLLLSTGRWFEGSVFGLGHRLFRELGALAPPAPYAEDYRRYLQLLAQQGEWVLAEARAFQLGAFEVPNTEDHNAEERRRTQEQHRIAAKLGISACADGATAGEA
jgi:hypothetical protein